jgi:hypothetical protein
MDDIADGCASNDPVTITSMYVREDLALPSRMIP